MARSAVLIRVGGRRLALPVEHVVETMRPLPVEPDATADPLYVRGTARIRGERCRVFDTAALLGIGGSRPRRFLVVRDHGQKAALQVEAVLDVCAVSGGTPVEPVVHSDLDEMFRDARWLEERR